MKCNENLKILEEDDEGLADIEANEADKKNEEYMQLRSWILEV